MKSTILSFIIAFNLFALSTETKIFEITQKKNEQALIYGFDGQVYFVPKGVQLDELTKTHHDEKFAIEFDKETNEVHSFIPLGKETPRKLEFEDNFPHYIEDRNLPEIFNISEYRSEAELFQVFRRQNSAVNQNAQCYDKAHYWSYEWSRQNLSSGKMFLFFTQSYIRRFNYKWWFHVAPTFQVSPGQVRVMDPIFSRTPLSTQNWTNLFVKSQAKCPSISHYNQYYHNQNTKDCYVRHTSQFYYHPFTIRDRDYTGKTVRRWNMNEVRSAYRNLGL